MSVRAAPRLRYRHASGLHAVARELHALHRELLVSSGEAEGHVRTSVTNLVAACTDPEQAERAEAALLSIGAEHPARALVILAQPEAPPQLEADVSLHAAGDGSHATTELVRLDVSGEPAYHLTGIVTPLLIPDMPTYLWVLGSPPLRQAFSEDAVSLTDRIIIDSGAYADAAATLRLISEHMRRFGDALGLADLAWERTLPWRQQLAQAFDAAAARPWLRRITTLTIRCAGTRVPADPWLLAGWMGSALGWKSTAGPRIDVTATGAPDSADVAEGSLLEVHVEADGDGGHAAVGLLRRGSSLQASVDIDGTLRSARSVTTAQTDEAGLISRLMSDPGDEQIYHGAITAAVAMVREAP